MGTDERFEELLAAAQRGEEQALAALYRRFQPSLLAYLRTQRSDQAEDLASETWIAAARGLRRFRGDGGDFRRWIFTIARRRLVDLGRGEARRPSTIRAPDDSLAVLRESPDAATEALESLATRQALEKVASLPPDEAEVVVLRVIAGLSAKDVASITGRSPGAVRVLQHRALRRLASLLDKTFVTLFGSLAI
ncbi:MAG: RNA polymerase sigma factor [Candidatus Limnocylindria bacterium]